MQMDFKAFAVEVLNIVAVPKGSGMYRWMMMMNIGSVDIKGIDVVPDQLFTFPSGILLNIRATYTYQLAQDFTKRKNSELEKVTYGGQWR